MKVNLPVFRDARDTGIARALPKIERKLRRIWPEVERLRSAGKLIVAEAVLPDAIFDAACIAEGKIEITSKHFGDWRDEAGAVTIGEITPASER